MMNQFQKIMLCVCLGIVVLCTLVGMTMVWVEDTEYAGKAFWSLAILFAGCAVASGVEMWFRGANKSIDNPIETKKE